MATLARQKGSNNNNVNTDDEAVSIDSMALPPPPESRHQPISLSKKAIHQRDADENLFLRFLELDPPTEVAAASSSAAGTQLSSTAAAVTSAARRHSFGKQMGRTPFTMTKKLTRTAERGFGFSIVWTHPPRVEKIEPGLSADRSGILPGDYVIFVDKHNVVTMPEADVLNLIRSQGATLTLEIFRRSGAGGAPVPPALSAATRSTAHSMATATTGGGTTLLLNGKASRVNSVASNCTNAEEGSLVAATATAAMRTPGISGLGGGSGGGGGGGGGGVSGGVIRPSTACSGTSSIEAAKRRLHLPQVTFSKESIAPISDNRRRFLLQLISREQNFIAALHFGVQRFVQPLQERKDLISPNDHRTLFQNIDELLRISEDILEQLCNDDQEPQMNFASRVYLSKTTAICAAYKKYCNGIKRADCVLVNKSRQAGSEFIAFITEPQVPRKRPDVCMLLHRPLQHFREILKLMQLLASNCYVDSEEHRNFSSVIKELQAAYREITVTSGLMEPLGEGRPLLTLQDLESRMVFTKCKPFTLAVQGRQWIFGGDLSRVEGRSVKPYWTLLFSDIIVFAKVSRDRVLFITEEPIPIANVVDSCFHMRKKTTEFRLTVDPNGRLAESPTGYCAPDLSRTPKKSARRKSLVLRAPSLELKAVWQNLLQRQIFLVNAALGSTPLSSPLDSPDVLNTLVPLSDIGAASASIGSIKLSMDSMNQKNQAQCHQQRHSLSHPTDQIELLIDEKCRILNKTGTPKSSALHLANWMKGQLDKQQEQARLAAERSREHIAREDEHLLYSDSDHDERITYWTRQQLERRTKELNLIKENGKLRAKPDFGGKRLSGVEELSMSEAYSENVSQLSHSRSTTSDSQITVRSSPNVLDKLAVCHHCHKHCQQSLSQQPQPLTSSTTSPPRLPCTSLKVQHSQSSSHRCCRLNGGASNVDSSTSSSSSTVTGEQNSEHSSSKLVAKVGDKLEAGGCDVETEGGVAALLTDEISPISQSEATDSNNALDNRKSTGTDKVEGIAEANHEPGDGQRERSLCKSFNNIRVLDQAQPKPQQSQQRDPSAPSIHGTTDTGLLNGHISSGTSSLSGSGERIKPDPPPRRLKITPQTAATTIATEQRVKTTIIITETAQVVHNKSVESNRPRTPKSPKSPRNPQQKAASKSPSKYTACSCDCTPADFEHTTLSPDELEQQTCKLIDSPKHSPRMLSRHSKPAEDPHKYCKCVCGKAETTSNVRRTPREHKESPKETKSPTTKRAAGHDAHADEDDDLSLMILGLAQFAPAAKLLQMNRQSMPGKQASSVLSPIASPTLRAPATTPAEAYSALDAFVPTIAVVPPTPDALLTKTTTNIWDNSSQQAVPLLINNVPRRPVIEQIPDDSCDDESPGDEEPPYRPMNKSLRRYGTMSSLEKLPSDMDDGEVEELEDDGNFVDNMRRSNLSVEETRDQAADNEDDDDDDDDDGDDDDDEFNDDELEDELRDELEAEFEGENDDDQAPLVSGEVYNQRSEDVDGGSGSAWSSRAGSFVAGKMSFFEESRAFIDKYLGRWNQEHASNAAPPGSEPDEQLDECTSGATSGEEIWGTPTSVGDNDELHLVNSENTHSSPTKSSTSLNDDDDTELMMDELLMAPPMTASTIRGLLPRRRLEPLFEEETESDEEEKTQQESDELKKGEATTNGPADSADSGGSSSEEDEDLDTGTNQDEDEDEDEDETSSTEERLQPNLPTTSLGPRPLRSPGAGIPRPMTVIQDSSCEYLLEHRSVSLTTSSCSSRSPAATASSAEGISGQAATQQQGLRKTRFVVTQLSDQATMIQTSSTMTMTHTLLQATRHTPSSISTTTSSVHVTTNNSGECSSSTAATVAATTVACSKPPTFTTVTTARPARFIPPPPPPRRLLLTQTNLKTSGNASTAVPQRSSGVSADDGSSAAVVAGDAIHKRDSPTQRPAMPLNRTSDRPMQPTTTRAAYSIRSSVSGTAPDPKRPSSTIIETSLLGQVNQKPASTSSTTASTTKTDQQVSKTSDSSQEEDSPSDASQPPAGSGLSPRLEMRLALNHDILGDEDLICYDPGPDLTTILGHDLSTFHRLTGRDLLHRSATNRVQPREAVISFSQQRNSKMDTPTVNRRPRPCPSPGLNSSSLRAASARGSHCNSNIGSGGCVAPLQSLLRPNRNTWSNSASADRNADGSASGAVSCKSSYSSDEIKLSDLEILARREKIFCMSQSRSGSPAMRTLSAARAATTRGGSSCDPTQQQQRQPQPMTTNTTPKGQETERESVGGSGSMRVRKVGRDETSLMETGRGNRLINFIKRRNSEVPLSPNCSQSSLHESNASSTPERRQVQMSPRKDNDKPSLNRRLWKQITKRRRANSVSEIAAN